MKPNHVESMVDEFGHMYKEVSHARIAPEFRSLVEAASTEIPRAIGDEFFSLYLYGSIPAGRAVAGRSDLDLFAILQDEADNQVDSRVQSACEELMRCFPASVRRIDVDTTWMDELFSGPRSPGLKAFVKHMCVCVAGPDISEEIPDFTPSREVCASLNGDAPLVIESLWKAFFDATTEERRRYVGARIATKILRTMMSVIAAETGEWATGRADMATYITWYYPDMTPHVEFLLQVAEERELALVGGISRLKEISAFCISECRRALTADQREGSPERA